MALISLTGLWKNEDKDYLSGTLGFGKIYIFKNKNKKSENSPDYNLVIASRDDDDNKLGDANSDTDPDDNPDDNVDF